MQYIHNFFLLFLTNFDYGKWLLVLLVMDFDRKQNPLAHLLLNFGLTRNKPYTGCQNWRRELMLSRQQKLFIHAGRFTKLLTSMHINISFLRNFYHLDNTMIEWKSLFIVILSICSFSGEHLQSMLMFSLVKLQLNFQALHRWQEVE